MEKDNTQMMKQALLEIRRLKAELKVFKEEKSSEIAIIGMGCKFPGGANSPEEYWQLILNGTDAVGKVPNTRWNRKAFHASESQVGKVYTDQGGFIDDVDKFDPIFFGISPREAEYIDPQHRLLLEVCWESLENAGVSINFDNDPNNTGVFVGLTTSDYLTDLIERKGYDHINSFYGIGNAHNGASGRISYTFGFTGPSITVDTACSSSLTSVHLACQSLIDKECNMAIAGGVNALLNPVNSIVTAQAKMLSPEGRCKTFDDTADGYIRSEGCGTIVLMRLEDAIKQNKKILATIKGSGVNHNAKSSSITVPNMHAQSTLIKNVLEKSNVKPQDVSYIEAHGTGTNLGDPIELRALQQVFGESHNKDNPLYIGAVKSIIGHAESAAGIAGVIKSVLSLQNQIIPGNIHFNQPNTNIHWEGLPFVVPTTPQKWNNSVRKNRLAGVSSFGVSGTNAHVLLEEYLPEPTTVNQSVHKPSYVFALSAKSKAALDESKKRMIKFLLDNPEENFRDICLSSLKGRTHFEFRFAESVTSIEELKDKLKEKSVELNVEIKDSNVDSKELNINKEIIDLYLNGQDIDFEKVYEEAYNFVRLPNYPFEKERYWVEGRNEQTSIQKIHPFCERPKSFAKNSNVQTVDSYIGFDQISDHCIHNKVTVPGAAYVEMMLAIGGLENINSPISLKNISFTDTVLLEDQKGVSLQCIVEKQSSGAGISIYYLSSEGEYKLCSGGTQLDVTNSDEIDFDSKDISLSGRVHQGAEIYSKLNEYGYAYGETYQGIKELSLSENTIVGTIDIPKVIQHEYKRYVFHPALLDACLQLAGGELIQREKQDPFVPVFIGDLTFYRNEFTALKCHVILKKSEKSSTFSAVYRIFNEHNEPVALLKNVIFRQLEKKPNLSLRKNFYISNWEALNLKPIGEKNVERSLLVSTGKDNDSFGRSVLSKSLLNFEEVSSIPEFYEFLDRNVQVDQVVVDFVHFNEQSQDFVRMEQRLLYVQSIVQGILKNLDRNIPELVLLTSTDKLTHNKPRFQNELFALTSVVNQEEPNLKMRTITVNPSENFELIQELIFSEYESHEERIIISNNVVYVQRLVRPEEENRDLNKPYKLKIDEPGSFSDIEVQVIEKVSPSPDEVAISVVASGVNFKEVLYALGALPMPKGEEGSFEFGFECSGIVSSVGDNVDGINVGDEVIAIIAPGSLGSYTLVHKNFIFPKPKELTFEEATTLPIVFITAYYGLMNLAKINADSKVLIHAAAGGVGLAAVQIAQLMGSEIFATASTPKHELLKAKGISNVYNSRTLDFADQIKHDINNEGLDVVLNSFSGEFMFKSLDLLKPNGCFIEIGKVNQEIKDKIKALRPDVVYHNFDIGEIAQVDHELIRSVFEAVLKKMESKVLNPVRFTAYGMNEVENAFSTFAKGKNIGKVVITHYQNKEIPLFYPEEHYVVTGGNGGLGSHFMQWMFEKGARNFIVLSRRGKPEANDLHEQLIKNGASIRYESVDVSDEQSVKDFFNVISHEKCNLRGIFHTAGVLNDNLIINQTLEDVQAVLSPKLNGTSYLDQYSRSFNLKHFVCFSSIASVFGTTGQFSYAGANAAMDTIIHNRVQIGLPGTTLNWGPFAGTGMARDLKMQSGGVAKLSVNDHFDAIEIALRTQMSQLCIADVNWTQLSESNAYYRKLSLLNELRSKIEATNETQKIISTVDAENIPQLIEQNIKAVLGLSKHHEISRTQSLFDYGLDSLMAVELKNRIEKISGQEIASTFLFNYPTLNEIIDYFSKEIQPDKRESVEKQEVSKVDYLSNLLDEELKELE